MEFVLKNDFSEIPPASDAVDRFLGGHGVSGDILYVARLVVEELVTNTIKYGYDDDHVHGIRIDARIAGDALILTICDDGHPFNPLDIAEPDTSLPADKRLIGGLGIYLVRSMTDSFVYERRDGKNIVTISKALVAPAGG